jgi:hypothetical protein
MLWAAVGASLCAHAPLPRKAGKATPFSARWMPLEPSASLPSLFDSQFHEADALDSRLATPWERDPALSHLGFAETEIDFQPTRPWTPDSAGCDDTTQWASTHIEITS